MISATSVSCRHSMLPLRTCSARVLEDMYGGKLVAAMDRQHPRDLFDVLQLFAHEGITDGIRRAFAGYFLTSVAATSVTALQVNSTKS
jgi:predicted nucleotidyltransferase component of viral defense system